MKITNKKGGFEMSITTLVIIVIAVVMLILGLVLVRQIFGVASESVSQVDIQVRGQLQKFFGEEGRDIVIYSKEVNIKPIGETFSTAFAAKNPEGGSVESLRYNISLTDIGDCKEKNNKPIVESWFMTPLNQKLSFDDYEVDTAYGDILINIPRGAKLCTQRVKVELIYGDNQKIASSFTIKVIRGGIFG